ncbi:DUF1127 domain-containing protein [Belnapia sp. T6]|uniref:DUF1127 domain-containing protein n=1 Tax=Belnapia mucosa TaxID=2804532 RepID=A0ABS1V8D0_9PROT|nr:DUF1127 domain-containing protein [Belnapia mucosa]MBL6456994.1 DUF1127 domain-containing protein [Belnapia mucosa]
MAILNIPTRSIPLPWPSRPVLPGLRAMLRAAITRRQLAEMDERMLSDIGISRVDALREADRLPWDIGPPRV